MKIKNSLMIVAACAVLAGCQSDSGRSDADAPASADEHSTQGKDEYLATVKSKMKVMDDKIDDLAAKSKSLKDDAKAQADNALAALREERAVLGQKYETLKKSSQDAWESAKTGFGNAWDAMQSSIDAAKSKFN